MKFTLLQLVQQVLSSIDGDEVNSINDSVESQQVIKLVKRVYGNLAQGADFPEQYTLFGLTASGDASLPCVMYLPTGVVKNMQWLKYNRIEDGETDDRFELVKYLPLDEFLSRMHGLHPSEDSTLETMTLTIQGQDVDFLVVNDNSPLYYTTIDDSTLIFDSYDSDIETTLQSSKTLAYGEAVLPWTEADSFVIPIDDHQLILSEAIALAWAEMKQAVNAKAERTSRDLKITHQRKKYAIDPMEAYRVSTPNYGRK
jgi:hypothetical protein